MGEHQNGRKAIDGMTRRIINQQKREGRKPDPAEARKKAVAAAIRHDKRK